MSNVETGWNEINDIDEISIDYNGKKYNRRDYPGDTTVEFYSVEDLKEAAKKLKFRDIIVHIDENHLSLHLKFTAKDYFKVRDSVLSSDELENYDFEWVDCGFNFYKD